MTREDGYGIYNISNAVEDDKAQCLNCMNYYYEECSDERNLNCLTVFYDEKNDEFFRGCPLCETDECLVYVDDNLPDVKSHVEDVK